jgi:25S rRNA (uracil2634-N3)-methyltransferase
MAGKKGGKKGDKKGAAKKKGGSRKRGKQLTSRERRNKQTAAKLAAELKAKLDSKKGNKRPRSEISYKKEQSIMVIGDGDFSFSNGLVAHRKSGLKIVATSYDAEVEVKTKYKNAGKMIEQLKKKGTVVLHEVDGTKLEETFGDTCKMDRIIWNFPHSGEQRVHVNRALLRDFFESALKKMAPGAQVHVSLKTRPPYSGWNIEEQAVLSGLELIQVASFDPSRFPGYEHKATVGAATFEGTHAFDEKKDCKTYVFRADPTKSGEKEEEEEEEGEEVEDEEDDDDDDDDDEEEVVEEKKTKEDVLVEENEK